MSRGSAALLASGLAALALAAGLAWWLAPLKPGALALQLAFTPRTFGAIVHVWSPQDLWRYRAHLPVDGLLLLAYGAFGWLLVSRSALFAAAGRGLRGWARAMLPLAAAFDAAENLLHAWLTAAPRFGVPWAYALSATCASLKWTLLLAFGLLVCALMLRARPTPR